MFLVWKKLQTCYLMVNVMLHFQDLMSQLMHAVGWVNIMVGLSAFLRIWLVAMPQIIFGGTSFIRLMLLTKFLLITSGPACTPVCAIP